jgi:hypothetical protein
MPTARPFPLRPEESSSISLSQGTIDLKNTVNRNKSAIFQTCTFDLLISNPFFPSLDSTEARNLHSDLRQIIYIVIHNQPNSDIWLSTKLK